MCSSDLPRFGEHMAFLDRMREAGYLVLAGPLADADGEGMTVLRLPGPGGSGPRPGSRTKTT